MTTRVFAYLRVSGRGQVEGDGFDRQLDAINKLAAEKGWSVARVFREEAVSGTVETNERPALMEAFSLCGPNIDTVIVERCDRIARDLIVSELFFQEAKRLGIKVYSADTGEELVHADSDPTRLLIRQVLGALSQWEKSSLVKKLRAARDRKRQNTGRCEGFLGVEHTNPEVGRIIVMRRDEQKKSFRSIAHCLNYVDKIPRPDTFKSKLWKTETVRLIYLRCTSHRPNFDALEKELQVRT